MYRNILWKNSIWPVDSAAGFKTHEKQLELYAAEFREKLGKAS